MGRPRRVVLSPYNGRLTVKHLIFTHFTYLDHCIGHLLIVAARGQPAGERERDCIRRVQLVFVLERTREPHGGGRKVTAPPHLTDTCFNTTTAFLPLSAADRAQARCEKTRWLSTSHDR